VLLPLLLFLSPSFFIHLPLPLGSPLHSAFLAFPPMDHSLRKTFLLVLWVADRGSGSRALHPGGFPHILWVPVRRFSFARKGFSPRRLWNTVSSFTFLRFADFSLLVVKLFIQSFPFHIVVRRKPWIVFPGPFFFLFWFLCVLFYAFPSFNLPPLSFLSLFSPFFLQFW